MISPRGEDGNWSMTIFRILISIESRRNIKSRRGIDESRSPNFPTIRKRFGGGRPTNVAESIVRHSRIGLAEVAISAPAFRGTGVSVESLFGPFLLVHAPQHEAQSLFRSRTRGLPFSLSLSPPRSSPLLLQSRPVINIYVDLLSSGIGAEYGKKSPSLPLPYQLIASRYSSFSSFLLVSLAIFKFKKKGRVDGQGFPLTRKLRFVALLFVETYAIYSLYRVICLLLTIQLGCCKNSIFVFYCKTIEIEAIFVDVTEIK